jgi:hypothetical protein
MSDDPLPAELRDALSPPRTWRPIRVAGPSAWARSPSDGRSVTRNASTQRFDCKQAAPGRGNTLICPHGALAMTCKIRLASPNRGRFSDFRPRPASVACLVTQLTTGDRMLLIVDADLRRFTGNHSEARGGTAGLGRCRYLGRSDASH